jgi:predicted P-loop ATPase
MTDSTTASALAYYSKIGAALFPMPHGSKSPTGIVASFALDCSADPAQWERWSEANPGCNFGLVAGPSRLIICDIDVKAGRDEAWAAWCEVCRSWGVEPLAPQIQSARGGWHVLCRVPDDVDARTLRQPDALKGVINIRAGNGFVVAAGSYYDGTAKGEASGPYILLSDAPPHPAPAALIAHCSRRSPSATSTVPVGSRDVGDVASLIKWLAERDAFAAYEDWVGCGMACKLEFGDAGLDVWRLAHDATVTDDVETTKWQSFATEPQPGAQTLNTWLDKAHKLGWRGQVRKSAANMFEGVASIASAAGATLSSAMPMMAGMAELARIGEPDLQDFLSATNDAPTRPCGFDFPSLPDPINCQDLLVPLRQCLDRMFAMAETPKTWKAFRIIDVMAVLSHAHRDTFEAACRRLRAMGVPVPDAKINLRAKSLEDKIKRVFVKQDDWVVDAKGEIQHDNSDNVAVFLGIIGAEVRWNAWLERAEIRGIEWADWTYIDDTVVAKLRTRGNRTGTRFRPGRDFFWETLLALAHLTPHDPVLDMLGQLATEWDKQPRLATWLTRTCKVPCDPYHQAVGRNIIGGIVMRARHPGCKHDTMPIFYGPQGTGKSTMAEILAIQEDWFTDNVLLGDAAKELVLSLAGKLVVEIGEMGMRGSASPNHVKAMISRTTDAGRTAYARSVTERHRRNIFIGTTNDDEPLTDTTGNRRFLPVRVFAEIDLQWLQENVRQLIGEAAHREAAGETFDLPREIWSIAADHQEAARSSSDMETMFKEWFAPTTMTGDVSYITAADLTRLTHMAGWRNGGATALRGQLMRKMGFHAELTLVAGKRVSIWLRGECPRLADAGRIGVRYTVAEANGWPVVTIRSGQAT